MRPSRSSRPRGRSGGRAGGSGYDFQDLYIAYQFAKLLVSDQDPPVEILWEKKALDRGPQIGVLPVDVDDAILHLRSGKWIYVQVKEAAPAGGWSAPQLVRTGVAQQFWREWSSKPLEDRPRTLLRLASCGDVTPLAVLVDVALRSRAPRELLSDEAAVDTADDIQTLATALDLSPDNADFLAFLKSIQAEPLCVASELEGWIIQSLAIFGGRAPDLARRLIRLVARSKHAGRTARSAFTKESLVQELQDDGFPDESLVAAGVLRAQRISDLAFWDSYRDQVVKRLRSFRVYGLQVDRVVYADLPTLFVPPTLAPILGGPPGEITGGPERAGHTPSLAERLSAEADNTNEKEGEDRDGRGRKKDALDLAKVLAEKRRFVLIGGAGTGKTTTLKWLAVTLALRGAEGQQERLKWGLSEDPLIPVYFRFRQFAERVKARGLGGVEGRAGLVADLLAAEFETGVTGKVPTRSAALQMAQEVLESDNTILLFDGLDEVADEALRNRLFEAVADLLQTYKAPRVVVSSRPYAFRRERSPLNLALFEPLPFDRAQRRMFAQRWYRALRITPGGAAVGEADARTRAEDLARAADALPDLSEVPLLLSMLALVHFNRQGLPLERATLYDDATLAMLGHWDRDPAGRDLGEDVVPIDWARQLHLGENQIRQVVEHLAYRIQVHEGGGEFGRDVAVASLSEGIASLHNGPSPEGANSATLLLNLLVDRAGLVQERSPDVFAFAHLSFQEYLAARSFVGRATAGLEELAGLAAEERHSEMTRFAASILSAEQRSEADHSAVRLIETIRAKNPVLAAACLLEAPRLCLDDTTAATLARAVYSSSSNPHRSYIPPRVAARLIWAVLGPTDCADRVLLDILSEFGERSDPRMFHREFDRRNFDEREYRFDRRHFRDFERGHIAAQAVLAMRPPRAMTVPLSWVLQRLSRVDKERHPDLSSTSLGNVASLLLIEAATTESKDHIRALVELLAEGERGGGYGIEGLLTARAERILRSLWEDSKTKTAVRDTLESVLSLNASQEHHSRDGTWAAAKFLLSVGERSVSGLAGALAECGFYACSRHPEASAYLRTLATDPATRELALEALKDGLANDDDDVRSGCSRLLIELGVILPGSASAFVGDEEDQFSRLKQLLNDPATASDALVALAEDLWGEDHSAAWNAARALIETGHAETPGVPHALVNAGLHSPQSRSPAALHLRQLHRQSHLNLAVRGTLLGGLSSTDNAVATASALLLIELEGVQSLRRLKRLVGAALGDPNQLADVQPHVRRLLSDASLMPKVLETFGSYLDGKPDRRVVCFLGRVLEEVGSLGVRNLASRFVSAGLSSSQDHEEVIGWLKRMLEDPELVTSTRRALSDGLASTDRDVAWGAARCLWETGSRTDPKLAGTLARVGLSSPSHRERARGWLLELLSHPRTARIARSALDQAADSALHPPRDRSQDGDLAWSAADCLVAAGMFNAEHLAEALVVGGLHSRENHPEALSNLRQLLAKGGELAAGISEALWEALDDKNGAVQWGAARALMEIEQVSQDLAAEVNEEDTEEDTEEEDVDGQDEQVKALARLWRVLIREGPNEQQASAWLAKLTHPSRVGARCRRTLVKLLADEDASVAYAAARYLVNLGETELPAVATTLVERGLTNTEHHDESASLLDRLRVQPATTHWATEALNRALWGPNTDSAWAAAVFLLERGEIANLGIPRGLVFGGLLSWRRQESEAQLRPLIDDASARGAMIDALTAALYSEDNRFRAARLLIELGAPIHDRVVTIMSELARWQPWVPLALLAVTDRVAEAREAAHRMGLRELSDILV